MRNPGLAALFAAALLGSAAGACRRAGGGGANEAGEAAPPAAAGSGVVAAKAAASAAAPDSVPVLASVRERLWVAAAAADADDEDLAALAVHEGAAGLVAAARAEPARVRVALRAAASARGYAQVPWLAIVAAEAADDDARLALETLAEIGARPSRAEEHEDELELVAGCTRLAALARETERPRARRVSALRAVRTLPCPKLELPTDLDAK